LELANKKRLVLTVTFVMAGMIVMFTNNSVINMLIPTLTKELHVTLGVAQWLSNGFIMTCGILVPPSAYLVRRFTYKQIFVTAQILFVLGSLLCALSSDFIPLLVGRLVQSVGTGLAIPLALNLIVSVFPAEKRGTVMGIYGFGVILAPAMGPSIGGFVIQFYRWNVLFWAMAALEFLILIGTLFFLTLENKTEKRHFDVVGFLLSAAGCGGLLYSISERRLWIAAAAIVILACFVFYSLRRGDRALLDLRVFKDFNFSYALMLNIIFTIAMYSGMLLMPQYLQVVRGMSPFNAALLIMPGSMALGILGVFAGRIFDRHGIKALAIWGSAIAATVTFLLSRLSMETPSSTITFIYLFRALGIAAVLSPIATAGLVTMERERIPHANAVTNTVKQIAGSVGSSAAVAVMTVSSAGYLAAHPYAVAAEAELHGINTAFLTVSALSLAALVLSLFYRKRQKSC
jgi:EmrB/QacA subfamily drug resistance transporter